MPSLSSYLQSLKAQLEPPVRKRLAELMKNFDEEVKIDGSPAKRILAMFVARIAILQLVKKMAEEALAKALYIERTLEKSQHQHKSMHAASEIREEEVIESSADTNQTMAKLTEDLNKIYADQRVLDEQYAQDMEAINGFEKEAFNEALSKNMGIPFTEKEAAELMDIYKNRPAAENVFQQLTKAITPNLQPVPGAQKKEDVDTKEQGEARAYRSQILQAGIKARAAQSGSLAEQIETVAKLRTMAPTAPLRQVLKTGNEANRVMEEHKGLRGELTKEFETTRSVLNTQLKGALEAQSRIGVLAQTAKIAAATAGAAAPSIEPTAASTPTPKR